MFDTDNQDDLFGGLFDFDGDGKTSLDEECLGLYFIQKAQEEEEGRSSEDDDYSRKPAPYICPSASCRPSASVRIAPAEKASDLRPLSEWEYRRKRNEIVFQLINNLVLFCLSSWLPIAGIFVAYHAFDGDGDVFTSVIAVAIWLWICNKILRFTYNKYGVEVKKRRAELREINARRPKPDKKQ